MFLPPFQLLSRLGPTKRLLALGRKGGLAVSDPYLSYASPLPEQVFSQQLFDLWDIGGIVHLENLEQCEEYNGLPDYILLTQWCESLGHVR